LLKRQREGRNKGGPPSLDHAAIRRMKADGLRPTAIAALLGVARSSVYHGAQYQVMF
jgi:DNA invertase Pin-like site-specific DNA recombinase